MHFFRGKYREEERVIAPSLDAIENAFNVLLALPGYDVVTFYNLEDHKRVLEHDFQQGCKYLFSDVFNGLKFFWYATAYKTRQITTALVQAYNTNNFLPWLILGRSTLEYAAVSYYFVKKIQKLHLQGPNFAATQVRGLEDLMEQYARSSRFDWAALQAGETERLREKFNPPESAKAINVQTALSHLARRDERYKDVEIAYDMLSDFAHPNMGSHAAILEMPTESHNMHHNDVTAQPGPLRGEFLMVVSLPWISMGVGTTVELLVGLNPLMKTWLDYMGGGTRITIDFTK
jgi:hypothetical protein